jgi:hypothetical protein
MKITDRQTKIQDLKSFDVINLNGIDYTVIYNEYEKELDKYLLTYVSGTFTKDEWLNRKETPFMNRTHIRNSMTLEIIEIGVKSWQSDKTIQ